MQAYFAAAAERQALWRGHHRFGSVFDGQVDVLELLDGHVQLVPLLLLGAYENQHQVRADGKIYGLPMTMASKSVSRRFSPL